MQNEKTITISNDFRGILANEGNEISTGLINEMALHKDEIDSLLTSYYCQERGTVFTHTIDPNSFETDKNGKGSFTVAFEIYYAMENSSDHDQMKIEFQMNRQTNEILLKGEVFS